MRYLLTSDLHANLPAARAAVVLARKLSVDGHFHIGDAIAIGPWPSETLDYLQSEGVRMLKGNHEEDVTSIGPHPRAHIGDGEREHNLWLVDQLRPDQIHLCENMPYSQRLGGGILLQHFGLEESGRITMERYDLTKDDLRPGFGVSTERLVVFGHIHFPLNRKIDGCEFRSFGTSGCRMRGGIGGQAMLLETNGWSYSVHELQLDWSINPVISELRARSVPDTDAIIDLFFNSPA